MGLSCVSGVQTELKFGSVRQFLNIPAQLVHKDNRMTGSRNIPASAKTGSRRGSCKLLAENIGGRHLLRVWRSFRRGVSQK